MDKKMTSGEIAKKVGISPKAIRLYDEKGLLKPTDYSEGNYRLYDAESILVLEKIIALKQIGFSLEEIYDNLVSGKNMEIVDTLKEQLELMEQRKRELEKTMQCISRILARTGGNPDWNDVAEIARNIQQDQIYDEGHYYALEHTAITKDWYESIYDMLSVRKECMILDLGCGFGKLWRNNWNRIPENVTIHGVDLHGSWAEDFHKYIEEHKKELSPNTKIRVFWQDVESENFPEELSEKLLEENAGNKIGEGRTLSQRYDYVIAHYIIGELKNAEIFIQRASTALVEGGMFSCNGFEVMEEHSYWIQVFSELKLKTTFMQEKKKEEEILHEKFMEILRQYFSKVEKVSLDNSMKYENSEDLFQRLQEFYPGNAKYIKENKGKIEKYFEEILQKEKQVIIKKGSQFWSCCK